MKFIMSIKKALKRALYIVLSKMCWLVCRIFPIKKGKIVISSYFGKGYGDNPKYIVEELLNLKKNLNIIWLVKKKGGCNNLPTRVKECKMVSFKGIYHLSTAEIWIDNCRKEYGFKRKSQFYIQTWHGFALKRIEKDAAESLKPLYLKIAKNDSKAIDLIVSDSEFMTNIYKNSFWYNGQVVEWGCPRNDVILNEEKRNSIREKVYSVLNLERDCKVVMYAPTFRANQSLEPYSIDYARLKDACEQRFGGKFIVFVRLHPNVSNKSEELNINQSFIKNVCAYPDMQELLAVAEVVVSDYSSLMFDFALQNRPCFQFATDIEDYTGDRNFYFELDKLPFSLAKNNDELVKNVLEFENNEYENKLSQFFNSTGFVKEGNSSLKCAKLILEKIET